MNLGDLNKPAWERFFALASSQPEKHMLLLRRKAVTEKNKRQLFIYLMLSKISNS